MEVHFQNQWHLMTRLIYQSGIGNDIGWPIENHSISVTVPWCQVQIFKQRQLNCSEQKKNRLTVVKNRSLVQTFGKKNCSGFFEGLKSGSPSFLSRMELFYAMRQKLSFKFLSTQSRLGARPIMCYLLLRRHKTGGPDYKQIILVNYDTRGVNYNPTYLGDWQISYSGSPRQEIINYGSPSLKFQQLIFDISIDLVSQFTNWLDFSSLISNLS